MTNKPRPDTKPIQPADPRNNQLDRLKFDLGRPAQLGLAALGIGIAGLYTLETTLNFSTTLAISLHLLLFALSILLAAYTFTRGHDATPPSSKVAARIVRAAVPYRSRAILLFGCALLLVFWSASSAQRFSSAQAELQDIEKALKNALERSDQALILSPEEAKRIYEASGTQVRGAGSTWLKFFLGIEARRRLAPQEKQIFFSVAPSPSDSLADLPEEGLALYPLEAENFYATPQAQRALARIQESRQVRLLGLATTSRLQLFSILLFLTCLVALLKHREDRVQRALIFGNAEERLLASRQAGTLRPASLWMKIITLEPFLCEFQPDDRQSIPLTNASCWVSCKLPPHSKDSRRGVILETKELKAAPYAILGFLKKHPRFFCVTSDTLEPHGSSELPGARNATGS